MLKAICFLLFLISTPLWAETKILFIGDSLTEGYGIEKEKAYPQILLNKLIEKGYKDITIINAGESGSKTSSALKRIRWHSRSQPDILVLALGANDGLRGIKIPVIKENLLKTIRFAKKKGMKVLLLGMQMPFNYGEEYRKEFAAIYPQIAKEESLPLVPFMLDGVARVKELNIEDGIHPNEKGHEKIAANIFEQLKKLL